MNTTNDTPAVTSPVISRRVSQISMSATKEMPILAARVGGCVSLGQGIPSFSTPAYILEAVCRALKENPDIGKYTLQTGLPELRRAVSDHLKIEKHIDTDPEHEVLITVGAMEALLAAILTVVDRGDEVILPSPAYASHIEQVLLAEGKPVFAPLRKENWGLDIDVIKRAVTPRTRALILCNPGNPTGAVFSDEDVVALCRLAAEKNFVIISDETYDYLTYDGNIPLSPASLAEYKDRIITISSFSKKYALTGWRIGWVTASRPLMSQIMKVHDCTAICAPTPSQYAALAALCGPQDYVEYMQNVLKGRRDLCCSRIDALNGAFDYVRPGGAFYIMARYCFTDESSRDVAIRLVNEARVITVPGASFGPGGDGHLRLSFGSSEDVINESFDRIAIWLKKKNL
ncbi:MAG: pyridoxal phosphate-dependent aminotransferase [Desulfobacterales bacterium]|nr:pyridoxal phosphate-dependent aminotransferase [Desulfobacterales bacterium]MDD4072592.1 pyridoxal phosphate-dependent aminotransferase [Desulfobacterales bacterium]MDD4391984.1 pyridoxal phosphate-dependent aminotransferase [Desulfobacterales bacterium]